MNFALLSPPVTKNAVTVVTTVTPSNGADFGVTAPMQDAVTRGNKAEERRTAVTAVTKPKKDAVTPEALPILDVTNVTAVTAKKQRDEIAREIFEERSGILEFDGGLPRDEAERLAERQVQGRGTETSWRWLIHFVDRDPMEVTCSPEASHAEILAWYPSAVAAEPVTLTARPSGPAMTPAEESAIRGWLARIREDDPAIVTEVIERCLRGAETRYYFIGVSKLDSNRNEV
jgi:hypothetical protein